VGKVLQSARLCLSVCCHTSKAHVQISPNFLYMLPLSVAWSFTDDSAVHYILPVLWICFYIMGQIGQSQALCYVLLNSRDGSTEVKVAVYDCRLVSIK